MRQTENTLTTIALPSPSIEPSKDSFLRLPAEVRIHVYSYLFPDKKVLAIRYASQSTSELRKALRNDGGRSDLAIVSTCRQIYEEACDALYGSVPYVTKVEGNYVFSCLSRFGSKVDYDLSCCQKHRTAEQKKGRAEVTCRNHFGTFLRFVRSVEVLVVGQLPDDWGHVHGSSLRNEISDAAFNEMFEAYDVRDTVLKLMRLLEAAPRLDRVNISVEWPGWYGYRRAEKANRFKTSWILQSLKSVRNMKQVSFGKIAPPRARIGYRYPTESSDEKRQRDEEHEAGYDDFKTTTAALMMSDAPRAEVAAPLAFSTVPSLVQLVRHLKGTTVSNAVCKALYSARHAAATNNPKRFEKEKDAIMASWKKEEARMKALMEDVKAPLERLRGEEEGNDGD